MDRGMTAIVVGGGGDGEVLKVRRGLGEQEPPHKMCENGVAGANRRQGRELSRERKERIY